MIKRPELIAKNAFDPIEWLKINHYYDQELIDSFTDMFPPDREDHVNHFITHCNLNDFPVEPSTMYYVAGPYNAYTDKGGTFCSIEENIIYAYQKSFLLWSKGIPCFTPHLNTANFHLTQDGTTIDESVFIKGLLDSLHRFSGVILLPTWMNSPGTHGEIVRSMEDGLPIYHYEEVMDGYWRPDNNQILEYLLSIRQSFALKRLEENTE